MLKIKGPIAEGLVLFGGAGVISGLLGWLTRFVPAENFPRWFWRYVIPGLTVLGVLMLLGSELKSRKWYTKPLSLARMVGGVGLMFQFLTSLRSDGFSFGERVDFDGDRATNL